MIIMNCYDAVSMVVEDANERFSPLWKINTESLDILKGYCDAIDSLAKEFGGVSFEAEVDEITMEITIALECEDMVIESSNHVMYELAKRSKKFGFSTSEDGNLLVKFVYPSLWDRA